MYSGTATAGTFQAPPDAVVSKVVQVAFKKALLFPSFFFAL